MQTTKIRVVSENREDILKIKIKYAEIRNKQLFGNWGFVE